MRSRKRSRLHEHGSRWFKRVALSFDDGPSDQTPAVLDALAAEGAPATFFVRGDEIAGREPILQRILSDGHELGNHSFSHPDLSAGGPTAERELSDASREIERATGRPPKLFRPPFGHVGPDLVEVAVGFGLWTVTWDNNSHDWAGADAATIEDNVVGWVRRGSIVLAHDGGGDRTPTVRALPGIVRSLRARGFRFVTVGELLKAERGL